LQSGNVCQRVKVKACIGVEAEGKHVTLTRNADCPRNNVRDRRLRGANGKRRTGERKNDKNSQSPEGRNRSGGVKGGSVGFHLKKFQWMRSLDHRGETLVECLDRVQFALRRHV